MGICVNICVLFFFGGHLITQMSYGQQLKTFRCKNGEYINNEAFCDWNYHYGACNYHEGRIVGCNREKCSQGKFSCDNKTRCLDVTVRCNTKKDCNDDTDELNCGDEINVGNCTSEDKFLCRDGLRCLDLEYTCDGSCNCFDCSDENSNCFKSDHVLAKECPNAYFITANGPRCLCDSNDDQSKTLCKSIKSCGSHSPCEQRCTKYKEKMQCSCYEGYHIINGTDDQISCRSDVWYEDIVLYATTFKIKSLNVTSKNVSTLLNEVHRCTALFAANKFLYYATLLPDNRGSIFKAPFSTGKSQTIIETDFPVTSVAVDYVTDNVYFTSNGSLSVCKNDGKICTKLKCCDIKYVVVAPKSGLMFYLKQNSMYSDNSVFIIKSNMDGSNETIFADDLYTGDSSMVVDESQTKLYLLETNQYWSSRKKNKIDRISFDGEIRESMITYNIRNLGVCNSDVFFTMDQENYIFRTKNIRNLHSEHKTYAYFRDSSTSATKFLYAYNDVLQRFNQNPCDKAVCSGLCLIKPAVESSWVLDYACLRTNNFTSSASRDNRWSLIDAAPVTRHGILEVVVFIFVFVILGVASYFMFLKQNWYEYSLALRSWWQNKRDQGIVLRNQEE